MQNTKQQESYAYDAKIREGMLLWVQVYGKGYVGEFYAEALA